MNVIHLFTLGKVERELVAALEGPLQRAFHAECVVSNEHFEPERFFDSGRNQYNSTSILLHLKNLYTNGHLLSQKHHSHRKTYLGITKLDLFIPILTFVYGEAELDGDVAVVSYHRLRNELYGLASDKSRLTDRLIKEAVHELGHAYGLIHCHMQSCVMHASTYVEDIDMKSASFCDACEQFITSTTEQYRQSD
jgi:archaemetzincin